MVMGLDFGIHRDLVLSLGCFSYHHGISVHVCSESRAISCHARALTLSAGGLDQQSLLPWHHCVVAGGLWLCTKLQSHLSGGWEHIARPLVSHSVFSLLGALPLQSAIRFSFLHTSGTLSSFDFGNSVETLVCVAQLLTSHRTASSSTRVSEVAVIRSYPRALALALLLL